MTAVNPVDGSLASTLNRTSARFDNSTPIFAASPSYQATQARRIMTNGLHSNNRLFSL